MNEPEPKRVVGTINFSDNGVYMILVDLTFNNEEEAQAFINKQTAQKSYSFTHTLIIIPALKQS